jgi:hypothetical protein
VNCKEKHQIPKPFVDVRFTSQFKEPPAKTEQLSQKYFISAIHHSCSLAQGSKTISGSSILAYDFEESTSPTASAIPNGTARIWLIGLILAATKKIKARCSYFGWETSCSVEGFPEAALALQSLWKAGIVTGSGNSCTGSAHSRESKPSE